MARTRRELEVGERVVGRADDMCGKFFFRSLGCRDSSFADSAVFCFWSALHCLCAGQRKPTIHECIIVFFLNSMIL